MSHTIGRRILWMTTVAAFSTSLYAVDGVTLIEPGRVGRGGITPGDAPDIILDAYRSDIDRLIAERGFKTVDVVSIAPDNPQKEAMRAKFLDEHFHKEDEVRFFVAGSGLFTLHVGDKVYEIKCEEGDLISARDIYESIQELFPNRPDLIEKAKAHLERLEGT